MVSTTTKEEGPDMSAVQNKCSPFTRHVGRRLCLLLKSRGWTLHFLYTKVEHVMSWMTLHNLSKGRGRVQTEFLYAIAQVLEVSMDSFVEDYKPDCSWSLAPLSSDSSIGVA